MTSTLERGRGFMKKWTNADRVGEGVEPTRASMKMKNFDRLETKEMAAAPLGHALHLQAYPYIKFSLLFFPFSFIFHLIFRFHLT